jgi:hypothetical protein
MDYLSRHHREATNAISPCFIYSPNSWCHDAIQQVVLQGICRAALHTWHIADVGTQRRAQDLDDGYSKNKNNPMF